MPDELSRRKLSAPGEGRTPRSARDRLRPLLAVVPVADAAKRELCTLMCQADRHYHGVGHLALLWRRHRDHAAAAGLDEPELDRLVGSAIAYHDAVIVSGRSDNETRSADLWWRASEGCAMAASHREWVADTIRATADHLSYAPTLARADESVSLEERARIWMLDLDLTPFGEAPSEFDANTERLRAEHSRTPAAFYDERRLALLRRFEASPWLFRSPVLAAAFEAPARRNIARALRVADAGSSALR